MVLACLHHLIAATPEINMLTPGESYSVICRAYISAICTAVRYLVQDNATLTLMRGYK